MGMDGGNMDVKIQENELPDLQVRPLYFVERRCTASWSLGESRLAWHDLTWVVGGRATYWVDDQPLAASAGDFLYLPAGGVRRAVTDPASPMHCLAFNFDCLAWAGASFPLPFPSLFRIADGDAVRPLYDRFQQVWLERAPAWRMEAQSILLAILHQLTRSLCRAPQGRGVEARLERIKAAMLARYAEPLTVAELAAGEGLHPVYFGQFFKEHMGLSVREYLARVRVHKAVELLSTGGYSVAEAAERSGFPDPFHFSRTCRRITGSAPSSMLPR